MLVRYLSKFVLQMMPSIVATVIGAYIVANFINPKPAAEARKPAIEAQTAAAVAEPAAPAPREVVTTAPPKPAAAGPVMPAAKREAPPPREKSANDLARAAIERLRGPVETKSPAQQAAVVESSRAAEPVRAASRTGADPVGPLAPVQTVMATPAAASVAASPATAPVETTGALPPLPSVVLAPAPADAMLRPIPPADVPQRVATMEMPGAGVVHGVSVADDFFSAVRSVFRAVTPP
jgi:hypothetical protein